ncbi:MAG: TIGR00282 family metallophosphoesterase [Dehalococcoidia bacterium]|nr:TIGR00282 family metallophosphoesterase [Dehalococcoidia bacterium]MDD5493050.1 TIGR00282 family metallophosphoesterase [Dehalococcoidia bacterium]
MNILVIGDIIGKPGRRALEHFLPGLTVEYGVDLVIANGENAAHGIGITSQTAQELLTAGVDAITTGNHVWAQREIVPYLNGQLPVIRPLNFPPGAPGRGYIIAKDVLVVNLIGRVFVGEYDCPFRAMDALLAELNPLPRIIIIDFHAEATSEKVALGRYLDGRVSAVLGTHTHIGTIDSCILPLGTAYVTDIGMVGPVNSIIGDDIDNVLNSFINGLPHRLSVGKGKTAMDAILLNINEQDGKARSIQRIRREESES